MLEEMESTIKFEHPRSSSRRSRTLVEDMPSPEAEMPAEDIPSLRAEVLVEDMSAPKSEVPAEEMESTIKFEHPQSFLRRSKTLVEDMPPPKGEMLAEDIALPKAEVLVEDMPSPKPEMAAEEMLPPSLLSVAHPVSVPQKQVGVSRSKKLGSDAAQVYMLREQCRQLSLSLFFREHAPVRSLGFTSSLNGEGKSFLALMTAGLLANDSSEPITLLECNWENPSLHQHFGFVATPGLAEWLRGECSETAIRHKISRNLTVIPAGDGKGDAVTLLHDLRQKGLVSMLAYPNGLLVVDLPSIVTTAYGSLAASLVESLIVVVRAGVTPDTMIAEACTRLKDLPVHGLILNQVTSRIPRWMRQML